MSNVVTLSYLFVLEADIHLFSKKVTVLKNTKLPIKQKIATNF